MTGEDSPRARGDEHGSAGGAGGTDGSVDRATVLDRVARVTDPELDRSIVELGYVTDVDVDGAAVRVEFRLPTAWCSPAFAWMMATDVRDEVRALGTVDAIEVVLTDHLFDTEITRGVNADRSFAAVFADASPEEDVDAVRETLANKARFSRQYLAVEALLEAGVRPRQVVELSPADLAPLGDDVAVSLEDGAVSVVVPADPLDSYLELARAHGLVTGPDDPLFVRPDGEAIAPDEFGHVHRRARLAHVNASGQASICEALQSARYDDGAAERSGDAGTVGPTSSQESF